MNNILGGGGELLFIFLLRLCYNVFINDVVLKLIFFKC